MLADYCNLRIAWPPAAGANGAWSNPLASPSMPAGPSRHYQRPEILGRGRVQSKCMLIDVRKVRNAHLCGYAITDHGPLTLPQDYSRIRPACERRAIGGHSHF
jgi:hypothetical protein